MLRRKLLMTLVLVVTACGSGWAQAAEDGLDMHMLNRLAFGPSADSVAMLQQLGVEGWVNQQLHPETIAEPRRLTDRLAGLETQQLDPVTLLERYRPPKDGDPDARKAARKQMRMVTREAGQAHLLRALYSSRQLQEVMVDFWFNHFNIFAAKGLDALWIGDYEDKAIRPHVMGRFRDLLEATARHPAMLFYLDNWQNTAPGSPGAKGKETGLNENYARELMELHTLGVDGGYTQDDVIALARVLTGWGIVRPRQARAIGSQDGFAFDENRHDYGDKIFLGHTIHGQGAAEIEQALDILAASPATAHHISFELAQYFVADQPPPALVERLTRRWMDSKGDIRAVLKDLFASPEFRSPATVAAKFKTPFQYVVSATRAADVDVVNFRPLFGAMKRLGQPLYGCLTPDGYKNTRDAWLNPDALALRISFATALGSGHMPLDRPPPQTDDEEADQPVPPPPPEPMRQRPVPLDADRLAALLGAALSDKTRDAVNTAPPQLKAAVVLGSPDFMAH
ncbi:MAG TPA: DUF1800 domain-containing protein [Patescibacteria group bacterium]|nr:DUF1800 domain-containing protein [Patescibacteria group bacterium]